MPLSLLCFPMVSLCLLCADDDDDAAAVADVYGGGDGDADCLLHLLVFEWLMPTAAIVFMICTYCMLY
jgi:hypothetical protein